MPKDRSSTPQFVLTDESGETSAAPKQSSRKSISSATRPRSGSTKSVDSTADSPATPKVGSARRQSSAGARRKSGLAVNRPPSARRDTLKESDAEVPPEPEPPKLEKKTTLTKEERERIRWNKEYERKKQLESMKWRDGINPTAPISDQTMQLLNDRKSARDKFKREIFGEDAPSSSKAHKSVDNPCVRPNLHKADRTRRYMLIMSALDAQPQPAQHEQEVEAKNSDSEEPESAIERRKKREEAAEEQPPTLHSLALSHSIPGNNGDYFHAVANALHQKLQAEQGSSSGESKESVLALQRLHQEYKDAAERIKPRVKSLKEKLEMAKKQPHKGSEPQQPQQSADDRIDVDQLRVVYEEHAYFVEAALRRINNEVAEHLFWRTSKTHQNKAELDNIFYVPVLHSEMCQLPQPQLLKKRVVSSRIRQIRANFNLSPLVERTITGRMKGALLYNAFRVFPSIFEFSSMITYDALQENLSKLSFGFLKGNRVTHLTRYFCYGIPPKEQLGDMEDDDEPSPLGPSELPDWDAAQLIPKNSFDSWIVIDRIVGLLRLNAVHFILPLYYWLLPPEFTAERERLLKKKQLEREALHAEQAELTEENAGWGSPASKKTTASHAQKESKIFTWDDPDLVPPGITDTALGSLIDTLRVYNVELSRIQILQEFRDKYHGAIKACCFGADATEEKEGKMPEGARRGGFPPQFLEIHEDIVNPLWQEVEGENTDKLRPVKGKMEKNTVSFGTVEDLEYFEAFAQLLQKSPYFTLLFLGVILSMCKIFPKEKADDAAVEGEERPHDVTDNEPVEASM